MSAAPVLGRTLTEATVTYQSILGGATMIACEARWDALGSGDLPVQLAPEGRIVDELDVADLESEAAHAYALSDARDVDNRAVWLDPPEGSPAPRIAEGGRYARTRDEFVAHVDAGRAARIVMRVGADTPTELVVRSGARELGRIAVGTEAWIERSVLLAADVTGRSMPISVAPATPGTFTSYHYWIYADPAAP